MTESYRDMHPLDAINKIIADQGLFGSYRRRHSHLYFYPPKDWKGTIYHFAYTPWRKKDPETGLTGFFALKIRIMKKNRAKIVKKVRFGRRKVARARAAEWYKKYYGEKP